MRRTLLITFVLAVLSVSAADGSPDTWAKSRKSTAPATASLKRQRHPASHAAGRAAGHESGHESVRASARRHASGVDAHSSWPRRHFRFRKTAESHSAESLNRAAELRRARETEAAERPAEVEAVSLRRERVALPPPLRGSLASLVRQNEKTEADGLERIEDDEDLNDRIARGMLVPVPVSAALIINGNLPENRRYCRSWTAIFLADLARAHAALFRSSLEVSSAVRTVAYQKQLEKVNGNAAAAEGEIASPHLTGAAIDIAKQGMSQQEIGWMRAWLLRLEEAGKIDVEEEFQQACFHITVYKSYLPPRPARKIAAQAKAAPSGTGQTQAAQGQTRAGQRKPPLKPEQLKPEEPVEQPQPAAAPAEAPVEGE